MRTTTLDIPGVVLIQPETFHDNRGDFSETFNAEWHIMPTVAQYNRAHNKLVGTIRGMHFQKAPFEETKIIRCVAGSIYDVYLDIRPDSVTFGQWGAVVLNDDETHMLYVPKGFAHGYQTLKNDTTVEYFVSSPYSPTHASGIKYSDNKFGISWPLVVSAISERDNSWKDFEVKNK